MRGTFKERASIALRAWEQFVSLLAQVDPSLAFGLSGDPPELIRYLRREAER